MSCRRQEPQKAVVSVCLAEPSGRVKEKLAERCIIAVGVDISYVLFEAFL